jgi:hypothetical protein
VGTPELEVVDVERGSRWCQVLLAEVSAAGDIGRDIPYVAVVSPDLGPELPEVLSALRPALQEIICCNSVVTPSLTGDDLAWRALGELGFGQDFVFTVPRLEDAVDYAVDTLLAPERHGWEGRFVVVIGPPELIARARAHLTEPG